MKKLDETVTLSILDEDNSQRVIFRIIPLCTKDGLIFQNRKTSYPDYGSLRIIPDKREQSGFKERMRDIGSLCCVQLCNDGKQLTKIRQNRNYDPNQGECNQYAIYSDVICGFESDSIFEVFPEGQDYSKALTETVLVQRGKVLYGPLHKDAELQWDMLKPFGNEDYLMHSVDDPDGNKRTYYWNPDALVTWRQRKKAMKHDVNSAGKPEEKPIRTTDERTDNEQIPIGTKLDILDEQLTNEEQISELNLPVSYEANRLEGSEKPHAKQETSEVPHFHGTPITEAPKSGAFDKQNDCVMHGVVERQLKEKQSNGTNVKSGQRAVENPIENLRSALQDVWQIPVLHQDIISLLGENREMMKFILQSPLMDCQAKSAYTAAKAELDVIESERLSLLVELDKVKANYQQTKDKMYMELAKQKQEEISRMKKHLEELRIEKNALAETLAELGDSILKSTMDLLAKKGTMDITTNGSDITISPTIGFHFETKIIVEIVRSMMSDMGFMCKQDCVTEFMVLLSLHDEICVYASALWESELYIKNMFRALGLMNVAAWPSVFGTLRIVSLLPENNLRTPTVEVIKNDRTPIRAYGHRTIRLIDRNNILKAGNLPVFRVPQLNKERGQDKMSENGKPVSLQTIDAFSKSAELLHKDGEAWFDKLEKKMNARGLDIQDEVFYAVRVFARVTAPQVIGGFMEAADAAVLFWIVPLLIQKKLPKEHLEELIGDLPRCMQVMSEENA